MSVGPGEHPSAGSRPDLVDLLRDLAALRDRGLLTEAELQRARAQAVAHRNRPETAAQPAR